MDTHNQSIKRKTITLLRVFENILYNMLVNTDIVVRVHYSLVQCVYDMINVKCFMPALLSFSGNSFCYTYDR